MRIEQVILVNLMQNEEYSRKVIPHIKQDYFYDFKEAAIASLLIGFFESYNKPASKDIIKVELNNLTGITDKEFQELNTYLDDLQYNPVNDEWLLEQTEQFCKDKAVHNAIRHSIQIIDGNDKRYTQDAIPSILSDALSISFDSSIGHDYLDDAEARYEFYHAEEERIPFDLDILNKITNNGLPRKTLTVVMAPPGVGKSIFLCHCASNVLKQGKNVLYITLEMAEQRIAERIDANLLNLPLSELKSIDKEQFLSKVSKLSKKTQGKLIIKEYPTSSAHAGHFRALLEELKLKKGFIPEFVCIDYINICASQRIKGSDKSYAYVKAIAEEIRGLAVEYDVPILSATQVNRCLALDTLVIDENWNNKEIGSIQVGDKIQSHSGLVEVTNVFPIITQEVYEITTKSGKKIVCSDKHIFPTTNGEKNLLSGLSVGDSLFVKK